VKLVDYLTIHYYSQEGGVPFENESPQVSKCRFQTLKALYDDRFVDQSWIQEPIRIIPRMKEIIELEFGSGIAAAEMYAFNAIQRLDKIGDIGASADGAVPLKLPKRSATLLVVKSAD
jgi:hypothetical protein